jgi:hypothetical protein
MMGWIGMLYGAAVELSCLKSLVDESHWKSIYAREAPDMKPSTIEKSSLCY